MTYLEEQALVIEEIMERQGLDFVDALDIARYVMRIGRE